MATVLRVKRRYDDEPLDALLIAGKKRKTEAGTSDDASAQIPLTAVVKFAGTVKNQEDNVVEHLKRHLNKDELKANYKQHMVDIAEKARVKAKQESRENRYKVINYFRSPDAAKLKHEDESIMTVIDVEDSISCMVEETAHSDKEIGYVYDLYYTQTEEDMHLDDDLSIHPFEQELVFDKYRENGFPDEECESEDSNSESNVKNDYPDSDHSENSIDDDDMRTAVRKLKIDGEGSDLSSEEDFVYAVDEDDVESYGYSYAKYKAKIKVDLDDEDSNHSDYDDCCVSPVPSNDDGDNDDDDDATKAEKD